MAAKRKVREHRLADQQADQAVREHREAIEELQDEPVIGARVIKDVELTAGEETPIAHGLDRPVLVFLSPPRTSREYWLLDASSAEYDYTAGTEPEKDMTLGSFWGSSTSNNSFISLSLDLPSGAILHEVKCWVRRGNNSGEDVDVELREEDPLTSTNDTVVAADTASGGFASRVSLTLDENDNGAATHPSSRMPLTIKQDRNYWLRVTLAQTSAAREVRFFGCMLTLEVPARVAEVRSRNHDRSKFVVLKSSADCTVDLLVIPA